MISQCPHCQKALQFTPAQQEKIDAALAGLKFGVLKLGCPHCKAAISLNPDGSLFSEERPGAAGGAAKEVVAPPPHPDISWLAMGIYNEEEVVAEEAPKAMILWHKGPGREEVGKAFADLGYHTVFPESGGDALVQMRFVSFAAVVLQEGFDGPLATSAVHRHLAGLPMDRRRAMFYAVLGKDFHTMYHLEALAYSANVVVNEAEAVHFDVILKKGMQEMQELFGPYVEAMKRAAVSV